MRIRADEAMTGDNEDDEDGGEGSKVVYVLHPNCAIEEIR